MKHVMTVFIVLIVTATLVGCSNTSDYPISPERLEGKTQEEMEKLFEDTSWDVHFQERTNVERDASNEFIEYGMVSNSNKDVYILVSATLYDEANLFQPVDLEYDGPRLDASYFDAPLYEASSEGLIGGGGAFEVGHSGEYYFNGYDIGCIDGDTSVFDYPSSIDEHVTNGTPSTRYLNLDTKETFSGGEEEWGQPASQFTCSQLQNASEVVLQTDPGDFLTGNYDRLLAWVWVLPEGSNDYELLNYNIVRQGLGEVAYEYGAGETTATVYDDVTYNEWMHQGEALAKEEKRGIHSETLLDPYWDYATDSPKWSEWPN